MSTEEQEYNFLGKGWAFPTGFNVQDGSVDMVKEFEDIEQSLHILLSTIPGERLMRPRYGCDLYSLVFENFTLTVQTRAQDMIEQAIINFEPRIKVESINIESKQMIGIAYISINYFVPKVNARHNLVYPFYFKEGTNLTAGRDLIK